MIRKLYQFLANRTYGILWGPRRYRYLFKVIRKIRPRKIMEIGTWQGVRASQVIEEAKKMRLASDIAYYGFDLFEEMDEARLAHEISKSPFSMDEIQRRLDSTGAAVHLYKGDSTKTLPRLVGTLPMMDFIFIDGGHSLGTVRSDWENVQKLMHERTIVIFDDYWRNRTDAGAKSTVDGIDRACYDVRILPRVDRFKKGGSILEIQFARVQRIA